MTKIGTIIVITGFGFYILAFILVCAIPWADVRSVEPYVIDVNGDRVKVEDYTDQEKRGREIYINEVCWQCHSQFVRGEYRVGSDGKLVSYAIAGEDLRYGPVSQPGESAYDRPHLYGTRRVGPDLAREGGKRTMDWQIAHLFNPRYVIPESIMPRFPWLFNIDKDFEARIKQFISENDQNEDGIVSKIEYAGDIFELDTNDDGIITDSDYAPKLNVDGKALLAYVERLGKSIGDWREEVVVNVASRPTHTIYDPLETRIERGKSVYAAKCAGCHGTDGNGHGQAAMFLNPRPRDFTGAKYKFRSTPSGLPTDEDIFRTITKGVPGTSMPSWTSLSETNRWYLVDYVKSFSDKFEKRKPKAPIVVPEEIKVTEATINEGKEIYRLLKCWSCHGKGGEGDGPSAETLVDEWGYPIRPYNFTRKGGYKNGSSNADIYRTFTVGLTGTPMPAYVQALWFTRENSPDFETYTGLFTDEQILELEQYVDSLIGRDDFANLSQLERDDLVNKRRWKLVHYVKSLSGGM